jgi:L-Ala-D/L-Glu epimerase
LKLSGIILRKLDLPLAKPYKVSYRSYTSFDPYVVETRDANGGVGWGEGLISPGSSDETRDGGWRFLCAHSQKIVGWSSHAAKATVLEGLHQSPIAGTALVTAIEMLERNDVLDVQAPARVPLLALVVEHDLTRMETEVESHIQQGFQALKVKVGFDCEQDLKRVAAIQRAARGRATITLDANRAFDRETAIRFASSLDPDGIDQLEQPCPAEDWEANAEVANASTVPLMLDESIMTLGDIERAARIPGVKFLKLKLRKFGSLSALAAAMRRIEELGLSTVLGDGTSTEIHCWMEACMARLGLKTPGQMNGFLKIRNNLFSRPLYFERGEIHLSPGFWPEIDRDVLERHTVAVVRFVL